MLQLLARFYSMDSWLKTSHNNDNKHTADDVKEAVKTNANRVFAMCLRFVRIGYQCLVIIFSIE